MSKFAKTHYATKFVSNTNNFVNLESSNSQQYGIEPETHYNPSSGQGNRSIARKSVAQKREKIQRNARTSYKTRVKQQESKMSSAFQKKVQKIDIDPTLLFANKHSRCSNYEKGNSRNPVLSNGMGKQRKTVSRDGVYREVQTEEHYYGYQERPQSKQSSRVKIRNEQHVQSNDDQFLEFKKQKPVRPQTSKCNRKKYFEQDLTKMNHQNIVDNIRNNNNEIQMKINFKSDKKITKHPMSAMNRQKEFGQNQRRHFDSSLDPQFLSLFAN